MKQKIWLDFETYSECNIKTQGGYIYAHDPSTQIIFLSWAIGDTMPVELWTPAKPFPKRLIQAVLNNGLLYAHNALFDWRIWNLIGVRDLGFPPIPLVNVVDTMALCSTFSLPMSLDKAGCALGLKLKKDKRGTQLIKTCCSPNNAGEQPMPWDYPEEFAAFGRYCIRDTESMRELVLKLPRQTLIPVEERVWRMTQYMNTLGLPIARDEADAILHTVELYIKYKAPEIIKLSKGAFKTINQRAKILVWCKEQGYSLPNMQAGTVETALNDPDIPEKVRELLILRQDLGKTSTAKFKKILSQASPNYEDTNNTFKDTFWVHDNLKYHGAGPGRWTGAGFQMQNLPRASVKNPDKTIADFLALNRNNFWDPQTSTIPDPVGTARALIRPMIKAPKGYLIMVADYNAVENRDLAWLACDTNTIQGFIDGFDQYVDMASARYHESYNTIMEGHLAGVKKYSFMRQMGKIIILGCGYGMGKDTFVKTALTWGVTISLEEGAEAVQTYREKYFLVKELWNGLKTAAVRAIITGQKQTYKRITFGTATVNGIRWLAMQLPSGKCIYYMEPRVSEMLIPKFEQMGPVPTITHMGVDPYTKKWIRLKLIPGRITENACQGTGREQMATGMLNVQTNMPEVILIGTVHDEALALIAEKDVTDDTFSEFTNQLCDIPWATDCPLKADGYIGPRYKKG